jgi:hypothetical protein
LESKNCNAQGFFCAVKYAAGDHLHDVWCDSVVIEAENLVAIFNARSNRDHRRTQQRQRTRLHLLWPHAHIRSDLCAQLHDQT